MRLSRILVALAGGFLFFAPVAWAQTNDTDELERETTEADKRSRPERALGVVS